MVGVFFFLSGGRGCFWGVIYFPIFWLKFAPLAMFSLSFYFKSVYFLLFFFFFFFFFFLLDLGSVSWSGPGFPTFLCWWELVFFFVFVFFFVAWLWVLAIPNVLNRPLDAPKPGIACNPAFCLLLHLCNPPYYHTWPVCNHLQLFHTMTFH